MFLFHSKHDDTIINIHPICQLTVSLSPLSHLSHIYALIIITGPSPMSSLCVRNNLVLDFSLPRLPDTMPVTRRTSNTGKIRSHRRGGRGRRISRRVRPRPMSRSNVATLGSLEDLARIRHQAALRIFPSGSHPHPRLSTVRRPARGDLGGVNTAGNKRLPLRRLGNTGMIQDCHALPLRDGRAPSSHTGEVVPAGLGRAPSGHTHLTILARLRGRTPRGTGLGSRRSTVGCRHGRALSIGLTRQVVPAGGTGGWDTPSSRRVTATTLARALATGIPGGIILAGLRAGRSRLEPPLFLSVPVSYGPVRGNICGSNH